MRSSRRGSTALLVAATVLTAAAAGPSRNERRLAQDLDRIFTAPAMEHGLWGVDVRSLDSRRVLYARNAGTLMMPASNLKILTLAAAAESLGWDYRFKTTLETVADVEDGALKGDLIVRGTGDPTINGRDGRAAAVFDSWAASLRAAGITRIDGGVVADDSAFDRTGIGQGWSWDYLQDGYAAPAGALEYNENVGTVTVRPGAMAGDQAAIELTPLVGLQLLHRVVTGDAGSTTAVTVTRQADAAALEIGGSIAAGAPPLTRQVAVANPARYFAHSLLLALVDRGIAVRGLPVEIQEWQYRVAQLPRRVLVETSSPPLREIATTMMKVSQNLYAETLLRAMGAARSGKPGSADAGIEAARAVFTAWGVAPDGYVQVDGSGLSRYDYVTAETIVAVLEHLHADPRHEAAFASTLAIAGKDGTVASRMKATRAEANAIAKTGSISNVRALSGYVRTRDGETLAFSILANSFAIPAATVNYITDLAVERLANHRNR
ncbi:MAG TPA: D-alanyl-D-alanine carboxypeptidase/D-alanyl-D-alanine-endopeptidase [Vicinamibacterales bacterium]|jgi:D-alanyl-D-alanine carboxypeptidase/D-alanyl-D-alanine-endopeptidase (penicillin-binding protein 4)